MLIALIEDEPLLRESLGSLLSGHILKNFATTEAFVAAPAREAWDLLLVDLCHAADPRGEKSIELLSEIRRRHPDAELVVQSGLRDLEVMRACVRSGADRFLVKDHMVDELPALLVRIAESRKIRGEIETGWVGDSAVSRNLKRELLRLRLADVDVLLEGETGSGKEVCSKLLHRGGPWTAVNMAAIPKDLFEAEFFGAEKGAYTGANQARVGLCEAAGSGTLFLDELQSLPLESQAKLLRVLESRTFTRVGSTMARPFRARVVCAANQRLREAVERGAFREDLYYRLAGALVRVPPLRARTDDIPALVEHFVQESARKGTFTKEGLASLQAYDWPGNVRELRACVQRLVQLSPLPTWGTDEVRAALVTAEAEASVPTTANSVTTGDYAPDWQLGFDANVEKFEARFLSDALQRFGSADKMREALGLTRTRYYDKKGKLRL